MTSPAKEVGKRASSESQTLRLGHAERTILERWVRARTSAQRLVMRSRIVLLLADGLSAREAARTVGASRHTVDLWRRRFLEAGCDALTKDKTGRGRKPRSVNALA